MIDTYASKYIYKYKHNRGQNKLLAYRLLTLYLHKIVDKD